MVKEQKILPINKYSVYELNAGIDKEITSFLEEEDFEENHKYSNLKILFGLFTVTCMGIAYLHQKSFPGIYYIILFPVIDTIFYLRANLEYCQKLRTKKHNKIKEIIILSVIEDKQQYIYKYGLILLF